MYCQKCGGKLESYASNCAFCGAAVAKYDAEVNYVKKEKKEEKKAMTAWRWVGFYLLPLILGIGSIIQIVLVFKWAFKNHGDSTLKGFARAQLLMALFMFILLAGAAALFVFKPELFNPLFELRLK